MIWQEFSKGIESVVELHPETLGGPSAEKPGKVCSRLTFQSCVWELDGVDC